MKLLHDAWLQPIIRDADELSMQQKVVQELHAFGVCLVSKERISRISTSNFTNQISTTQISQVSVSE